MPCIRFQAFLLCEFSREKLQFRIFPFRFSLSFFERRQLFKEVSTIRRTGFTPQTSLSTLTPKHPPASTVPTKACACYYLLFNVEKCWEGKKGLKTFPLQRRGASGRWISMPRKTDCCCIHKIGITCSAKQLLVQGRMKQKNKHQHKLKEIYYNFSLFWGKLVGFCLSFQGEALKVLFGFCDFSDRPNNKNLLRASFNRILRTFLIKASTLSRLCSTLIFFFLCFRWLISEKWKQEKYSNNNDG